jgi:hypothetical protein
LILHVIGRVGDLSKVLTVGECVLKLALHRRRTGLGMLLLRLVLASELPPNRRRVATYQVAIEGQAEILCHLDSLLKSSLIGAGEVLQKLVGVGL